MRFLLVGNYGVGNLGDEALKDYFLKRFPNIEWSVLSAHPKPGELPRLPGGIRSFLRFDWMRTLKALRQSDGMVFGGGSLFTDQESVMACVLWGIHAFASMLLRKPYFLAFQGIGPFRTGIGKWIGHRVCSKAAFLSVRDEMSTARVAAWRLNKNSIQTFDPVFDLIEAKKIDVSTKNILILIPRVNSGSAFLAEAKKFAEEKAYASIRILLLQSKDPKEVRFAAKLRSILPGEVTPSDASTLHDLVTALSHASLVLTERYHGALAALALAKETVIVTQRKDDKLASLQGYFPVSEDIIALLRGRIRAGETALREAFRKLSA
ncbi:hypothetical protein A2706_05325 [Candidatus Peribacteria bacterium RIFCSPHIGHO2_01_FULL_51_35]|nr:MAG: hypothetical protein A2706_05325 [Candidatus Peribacteria bacterium RIFCSPHIGHO2_01_FULL_51_35]